MTVIFASCWISVEKTALPFVPRLKRTKFYRQAMRPACHFARELPKRQCSKIGTAQIRGKNETWILKQISVNQKYFLKNWGIYIYNCIFSKHSYFIHIVYVDEYKFSLYFQFLGSCWWVVKIWIFPSKCHEADRPDAESSGESERISDEKQRYCLQDLVLN